MADVTNKPDKFEASTTRGGVQLHTLTLIRWSAVLGQTIAILFVHFYLGYDSKLPATLLVIAISAGYNLSHSLKGTLHIRLNDKQARAQLIFDQVQLGVLLYLTGGLINPFVILLLVPTSVSAALLSERSTYQLLTISLIILVFEAFTPNALPWNGPPPDIPATLLQGMGLATGFAMIFTTVYMARVAREMKRQEQALTASKIALKNEQKLSALGAMAAATAHELGTPLGTILLITSEMLKECDKDNSLYEDLSDLNSEAMRCRKILSSLSQAKEADDDHFAWQSIEAFAREAASPHENRGVTFVYVSDEGKQPMIKRRPEGIKALRNIMENAAGYASHQVTVTLAWDEHLISITVTDDGPGFSMPILKKLGAPYVTTRKSVPGQDGGMGLGLFIAKTLIEQTGGSITFENSPKSGAKIEIIWQRHKLETPKNNIWNNASDRLTDE